MSTREDEQEELLQRRFILALEDYDKQRTALLASLEDADETDRVQLTEALHAATATFLRTLPVIPEQQHRTLFRRYGFESLQIQNDLQLVSQEMESMVRTFSPSGSSPGLVSWDEERFSHFSGRLVQLRVECLLANTLLPSSLAAIVMEAEASRLFPPSTRKAPVKKPLPPQEPSDG